MTVRMSSADPIDTLQSQIAPRDDRAARSAAGHGPRRGGGDRRGSVDCQSRCLQVPCVSGYSPLKSEISPVPLMRRVVGCRRANSRCRLWSVVDTRSSCAPGRSANRLVPAQWGIREPKPEAPEAFPDILIVPLVAFDRSGYRLGYGAGYYDMTIARLRKMKKVVAIGIAFAAQEVDAVPKTARDEKLDLVFTEREVIDLRRHSNVRILFIGDIVGRSGRAVVK